MKQRLIMLASALLITALNTFGLAGSLNITPLNLSMSLPRNIGTQLEVTNSEQKPAEYQVEVMAWTQVNGEDRFVPTRDIVVNPTRVMLKPNQRQLFRLGWKGAALSGHEQMYRIYLTQMPADANSFTGVQTMLRVGLPISVTSGEAQAQLKWQLSRSDNQLLLTVTNLGSGHARLSQLQAALGDEKIDLYVPFYVLAGSVRTIPLGTLGAATGGALQLTMTSQSGEAHETLALP